VNRQERLRPRSLPSSPYWMPWWRWRRIWRKKRDEYYLYCVCPSNHL